MGRKLAYLFCGGNSFAVHVVHSGHESLCGFCSLNGMSRVYLRTFKGLNGTNDLPNKSMFIGIAFSFPLNAF